MQAQIQQAELFPAVPLLPGEVEAWRQREPLTVSQWAERHRMVTDGPWRGRLWRNEHTRYLVEPMDTWASPQVREEWIIGPFQSGKTSILYNCWAYGQHYNSAWAIIAMADENSAKRVSNERLQPIIRESPALAEIMTGSAQDLSNYELRLQASMTYLAWPRSEASLATFPVEHVFLDEVDIWKSGRKDNMGAVDQARVRTTTYQYTGKVLGVTTCTVDHAPGWYHLLRCQEVRVYMARCPHCDRLQIMRLEGLRWDDEVDATPDRVEAENLAWYQCAHCAQPWSEMDRRRAVRHGQYQPHHWDPQERWWTPCDPVERPIRVGFHFSAFYSPFVSLGQIASQAIKARTDSKVEQALYNRYLALPWKQDTVERQEDEILALVNPHHPRDLVPPNTACLILTADSQDRGFFYELRAWLYGEDLTSQGVRAGYVESKSALEEILTAIYRDPAGRQHRVAWGLIDSMGHRTAEVWDWCRGFPARNIIFPSQGAPGRQSLLYRPSQIEFYPGTTTRIPGGVKLYRFDTHAFKDLLSAKLAISPDDPGAWRFHAPGDNNEWNPLLREMARHYTAEYRDDNGLWQCRNGHANHYWDVAVLQLLAAYVLDLKLWNPEPAGSDDDDDDDDDYQPRRSLSRW